MNYSTDGFKSNNSKDFTIGNRSAVIRKTSCIWGKRRQMICVLFFIIMFIVPCTGRVINHVYYPMIKMLRFTVIKKNVLKVEVQMTKSFKN